MSSIKPPTISSLSTHTLTATPVATRLPMSTILGRVRLALCVLLFALATVIVGLAARDLKVYRGETLSADYMLPLWPENLHTGGTIFLVAGGVLLGVFAAVAGFVSCGEITSPVLALIAPVISLGLAISMLVYHILLNKSTTNWTIQTWSCQWASVGGVGFGTVCQQEKVAERFVMASIGLEGVLVAAILAAWVLGRKRNAVVEKV